MSLTFEERDRLIKLANCANAAYPDVPVPDGYRPFSNSDWDKCVLGRHYDGFRYDNNGYLYVGSGLRARFMEDKANGNLVLAWSGCDIDAMKHCDFSGLTDAGVVIKQYCGNLEGQYKQAASFVDGILLSYPNVHVDVVGHSLGGGITTYVVASVSDSEERVRGVTFNGLGLSKKACEKHMTPWRCERAGKQIVNIKCDKDPVFAGLLVKSKHFGTVYDLSCGGVVSHSMADLIKLMDAETSMAGGGL